MCDLSPDGELFLFCLAGGLHGRYRVYAGVSRAPWLHPLASWEEHGLRAGSCFATESTRNTDGEPIEVDLGTTRVVIKRNGPFSYVNERRRGWVMPPEAPIRYVAPADKIEDATLEKESPSRSGVLRLTDEGYQPVGGVDGLAPAFDLQIGAGGRRELHDAAWADWDHRGRLLVATKDGRLRAMSVAGDELAVVEEHDLTNLTPNPQPAPAWATVVPPGRSESP